MPRRSRISGILRLGLCWLLLFPLVVQVRAELLPWANQELYYEAVNEPLAEMLRAVCLKYNTAAVLSPNISGTVSGTFRFKRAADFLDAICKAHGISWYYDGTTVYFDKLEEHRNATVRLRWMPPEKLRSILTDMGMLDARFPWRAHKSHQIINISGPPRYVETILALINDMDNNAAQDMQMRVFRLKHAWADDFTLESNNSTLTIPGVATLLRNITGDGGIQPGAARRATNPVGLRGQGLARNSANQPASASSAEIMETEAAPNTSARILADPRLNAVIVWDVRDRMEQYSKIIEELDRPVQLVEIEVAILEVNVNRVAELGLSWSGRTGGTFSIVGGINAGTPNNPVDFRSPYGSGLNVSTIYTSGLDRLMARVHALEETGDAAVLSRPKVLTLDNMQASLEHVSTFYVRVAGYQQVDLFDVTYGTVLRVTPHVEERENGTAIRMLIQVEDGNDQQGRSVDQLPIVGRTSIRTQAVVNENQALVIGGYYYERTRADVSGLPVLLHIPILGYLFKTESSSVQRIERLFAIAPRLVNLAELTAAQQAADEAFTRDFQLAQQKPLSRSAGGCAHMRNRTVH
jgi:type III secretion protein C